MSEIGVLHLTPSVGQASYGVGPVVLSLGKHQKDVGVSAEVWCVDRPDEINGLTETFGLAAKSIRPFPSFGPKRFAFSRQMARALSSDARRFDIVHQHGLWTAISRVTVNWRAGARRPTILAPHGSLEPWALSLSAFRKRLALGLYERRNLNGASCLHALSSREARGFRAFGLRNPIAVIPNGISESWLVSQGDRASFRQRHGISSSSRVMLFLGRITPIKGLPMFLRAMAGSRDSLKEWVFAIAGVDEFGHQAEVVSLIRRLNLDGLVRIVGPQYGQQKADAFAAADLFVLPSHSEASPLGILEALGAGIPVLATRAAEWEELRTHDCGWTVDISEQALAEALTDMTRQPPVKLREMGARGKAVVRQGYSWAQIAQKTATLYQWLLNGGPIPKFVLME